MTDSTYMGRDPDLDPNYEGIQKHYSMKIKSLTQTCHACPTQYSGETDDGKEIYIRYRFGNLRLEVDKKEIYTGHIGDEWDGCISLDKIKELTKHLNIEWPETLGGWKDPKETL